MSSPALIEKCCLLTTDAAGDPTHFLVEHALAELGLDWRFLTFEISPDRLPQAIAGVDTLGFRGVLLAPSLRTEAASIGLEPTAAAGRTQTANCLMRVGESLVADNTQVGALRQLVGDFTEHRVVIVGADGIANTLTTTALAEQPAHLLVVVRDHDQLANLQQDLETQPGSERLDVLSHDSASFGVPPEATLLVWTDDTNMSCDPGSLHPDLLVIDCRMTSSRTALMRDSAHSEAKCVDGIDFFVHEVALAVERWTGKSLQRGSMRDAVEEFLGV